MAKINDIDRMTFADLTELKARIEKEMVAKRAEEAAAIKAEVEATITDAGFTFADIFGGAGKRGQKASTASVVKYRNPKDPTQTWTGRGRKPNWLVEAEAKGASLEKFAA